MNAVQTSVEDTAPSPLRVLVPGEPEPAVGSVIAVMGESLWVRESSRIWRSQSSGDVRYHFNTFDLKCGYVLLRDGWGLAGESAPGKQNVPGVSKENHARLKAALACINSETAAQYAQVSELIECLATVPTDSNHVTGVVPTDEFVTPMRTKAVLNYLAAKIKTRIGQNIQSDTYPDSYVDGCEDAYQVMLDVFNQTLGEM